MIFEIMIKKDNWAKGTDVGKSLNVTDLELSKIFNTVSYNILLSKKELKRFSQADNCLDEILRGSLGSKQSS